MRLLRVGGAADRCGLSPEMYRLRTSDYDSSGESGEKCAGCGTKLTILELFGKCQLNF